MNRINSIKNVVIALPNATIPWSAQHICGIVNKKLIINVLIKKLVFI
jgi:hypothetical protein